MKSEHTLTQPLETLPQGITFPQKITFDKEKKVLILTGQLTENERNDLLRLSTDGAYCHAIEQLYKMSQEPPDKLKWREPTDEHFVTEIVSAMSRLRYILLAAWFIGTGGFSIWGLFYNWPVSVSSTEQIKQKLDSVLTVQGKKIDSLQTVIDSSKRLQKAAIERTNQSSKGVVGIRSVQSTKQALASVRDEKADTDTRNKIKTEAASASKNDTSSSGRSLGESKPEIRYLMLALLAGVLGGAARGLSSLVMYRGNRRLFMSWTLWYFSQPLLGGMFAVVGLSLLKAGLLGNAGGEILSPSGVVALSALIGLFVDEFTNKLSEVFKTFFATKDLPASEGKIAAKAPEAPLQK